MRADSFLGQVVAVLSRRTPAFQPSPGEPSTFPGTLLSRRTKAASRKPAHQAIRGELATGNTEVVITGGAVSIGAFAVGDHAQATFSSGAGTEGSVTSPEHGWSAQWDVGIITVLSGETAAVADVLTSTWQSRRTARDGLRFLEVDIETAGKRGKVVAAQAADQRMTSLLLAVERLQQYYNPAVIVVVGIARGIHPAVNLGDVVVAREVVKYGPVDGTADTGLRRQELSISGWVQDAVTEFFSDDKPGVFTVSGLDGTSQSYRVLSGAILSVSMYRSGYVPVDIRGRRLAVFEAAGILAEALRDQAHGRAGQDGWLAVCGITDSADINKDRPWHEIASRNAAAIIVRLLPYLLRDSGS